MTLPKTSFAMVLTARRTLEPLDLPLPEIDADSGLVCIEACGICGSDTEQAIRTLAREIPGEESIHSCLIGSGALGSIPRRFP